MITFVPYAGEHVLVRLGAQANGDEIWGCGDCGHTRLINFGAPPAHRNELVQAGNVYARHCMASSCSPELDAAVTLRLTAQSTPAAAGAMPDEPPVAPRTYSSCGVRWKK